jgi:hypothetical protein
VLKKGGHLLIRVPNLRLIAERYVNHQIPTSEFVRLIYGQQDHKWNFHKAGFDLTLIKELAMALSVKIMRHNSVLNNLLVRMEKL